MRQKKNGIFFQLADGLSKFAQRFMPEAYVFALLLTAVVFAAGIVIARQTPLQMVTYFSQSMWSLLEFGMQTCLMIVLSTVAVGTRVISQGLKRLAAVPKTPVQAIVFGSFLMLLLFSVNSTFALVFGAIYAKEVAKGVKRVHYPLLVAVCYCGYITWQGGFGGTTLLLMATEGSWASNLLGYAIPLEDMIFSPLNLTLMAVLILTIPVLARLMTPNRQEDVISADLSLITEEEPKKFATPKDATPAQKLEYSRIPTLLFGIFIFVYIIGRFIQSGIGALDLNMLNFILMALSLVFVDNALDFLSRISAAAKGTAGVMVQFPIYAGIMGMMSSSNLGMMMSGLFIRIASPHTLPNIIHLSSALLNIFVPSGGGQWVIEAPIYLPVAQNLGTPVTSVVIAAAYGDALTNLIQPFWALPLLTITRLSMRDIMGYCAVICIYGLLVTQLILFLFHIG